MTLADLLEHDVRQFGSREAVTIDDRSLTFAGLARLVEAARATLTPLVGEGERVALALPNSFAWIAFFLAAAGLKAVSVPINTRLTPTELRVILEDSEAAVLVTAEAYRGRRYAEEALDCCRNALSHVVSVSGDEWRTIATGTARRPPAIAASGIFCIQYTSGTTATPKGVMLTEAAYLQTASWVARCQMLTPSTSFMSAAPFFHCSGSMHAVTTNLLAGSTLHSVSVWNPDRFLDLIQRHRGQASHGIFFRDIVALGRAAVGTRLATLKVGVDIGGPDFVRQLHDEYGVTGIGNIYGMTEQCGNFTMWFPDDPLEQRIVMSGRPQPGNRVRIADPATGTELPPGAEGEIQMRGPTVTPGYFRRPEANRAAFTGDGWFRSGDLGALTADHALHFLGRLRDMIRVGGENVSPSEVELAVARHTSLERFSVIGVPDGRLGEVVALVVPASAALDWPSTLQALSREVAGFKLPKQVWAADEFPMTATNKVQRATLQRWVGDGRLHRLA